MTRFKAPKLLRTTGIKRGINMKVISEILLVLNIHKLRCQVFIVSFCMFCGLYVYKSGTKSTPNKTLHLTVDPKADVKDGDT